MNSVVKGIFSVCCLLTTNSVLHSYTSHGSFYILSTCTYKPLSIELMLCTKDCTWPPNIGNTDVYIRKSHSLGIVTRGRAEMNITNIRIQID